MNTFLIGYEKIQDQTLSRLKSHIELMYVTNGYKKMVVVPHSMGVIYFLHFPEWVKAPTPRGGGAAIQAASSGMDGFKALEDSQGYDCKFETTMRSCNYRYSLQTAVTLACRGFEYCI
ncbi:hypothetical protein SADUNF_Sadunf09G0122600 [Salix dunnii]|uniref:Uncharacterized protein n=1 Tax=Salix dunnii TaxID=1413687 RepID=A0A835MRJ9_9ROSI|nr:hypothetical protein SADUNF_Sadunf09G0122600 [Salix dunnii]